MRREWICKVDHVDKICTENTNEIIEEKVKVVVGGNFSFLNITIFCMESKISQNPPLIFKFF